LGLQLTRDLLLADFTHGQSGFYPAGMYRMYCYKCGIKKAARWILTHKLGQLTG